MRSPLRPDSGLRRGPRAPGRGRLDRQPGSGASWTRTARRGRRGSARSAVLRAPALRLPVALMVCAVSCDPTQEALLVVVGGPWTHCATSNLANAQDLSAATSTNAAGFELTMRVWRRPPRSNQPPSTTSPGWPTSTPASRRRCMRPLACDSAALLSAIARS